MKPGPSVTTASAHHTRISFVSTRGSAPRASKCRRSSKRPRPWAHGVACQWLQNMATWKANSVDERPNHLETSALQHGLRAEASFALLGHIGAIETRLTALSRDHTKPGSEAAQVAKGTSGLFSWFDSWLDWDLRQTTTDGRPENGYLKFANCLWTVLVVGAGCWFDFHVWRASCDTSRILGLLVTLII